MENTAAIQLLDKIEADLNRNGIITNTLVTDLKELRPYAIEEEDPTLTKVIRLTYELLENTGGFEVAMPVEVDEEGVAMEAEESTPTETMLYLVSIMRNAKNPINREDLFQFRDNLKELVG